MENVEIFKNPEFGEVRTLMVNNEPWFVGKDVAAALGYANTNDALVKHVDPEDKKMGSQNATPSVTDSLGREQYPVFINESGLYSLVLSSKLPSAKQFKQLRAENPGTVGRDRSAGIARAYRTEGQRQKGKKNIKTERQKDKNNR